MSKKTYSIGPVLLAILAIAVVIESAILIQQAPATQYVPVERGDPVPDIPIALEGFQEVDITVSPSIIYVTAGCRQIAMATTSLQTYSIQNGLQGIIDFRPTSHDIFKDLIENTGMRVRLAKIETFADSTYYTKLYVQDSARILALDTRPSDSIAIAVRLGAPIYVADSILDEAGKDIC